MLTRALLTYRMHRFEVTAATGLLALVALASMYYAPGLEAAIPDSCATPREPACLEAFQAFWGIGRDSQWLRGATMGVVGVLAGVILGVPVVARELELRTVSLAWSLAGDRRRWLLQRFIPVLGLAAVMLAIAAAAEGWLHAAGLEPRQGPDMDWLGAQGPTFFGRGIMALGLALLVGALIGRTLPAFLVAGSLALLLVLLAAPVLQRDVSRRLAVWVERPYKDECEFEDVGLYLERWTSRITLPDGTTFHDEEEFYERCYEAGEVRRQRDAAVLSVLVTPTESLRDIEWFETAVGIAFGGVAMLLTFPVVQRRRAG